MLFTTDTLRRLKKAMEFANQIGNPSAFNKLLAQHDAEMPAAPAVQPISTNVAKLEEIPEPIVRLVAAR